MQFEDSLDTFKSSRLSSVTSVNLTPSAYAAEVYGRAQGKRIVNQPQRTNAEAVHGQKHVAPPERPGGDDKSYGFSVRPNLGGSQNISIFGHDGPVQTGFGSGVKPILGPNSAYRSSNFLAHDPSNPIDQSRPGLKVFGDQNIYKSNVDFAATTPVVHDRQAGTAPGGKDSVDIVSGYSEAVNMPVHTTINTQGDRFKSNVSLGGGYPDAEPRKTHVRAQLAPTGGQTSVALGGYYDQKPSNEAVRFGRKAGADGPGGRDSVAFDNYYTKAENPTLHLGKQTIGAPGGVTSVAFDAYNTIENAKITGGKQTAGMNGGRDSVTFDGYSKIENNKYTGGKQTYGGSGGAAPFAWSEGTIKRGSIDAASDLSTQLNLPRAGYRG